MNAIQTQLKETLRKSGIPAKEIQCYGSQVVITAWCRASADRWFRLLQQFCSKVRGPTKSIGYKEPYNAAKGTYSVWLIGGTI